MTSEDSESDEVEVANSVQLMLPFPETTEEVDRVAAWLTGLAASFPLDTGYAAPAVVATSEEAFVEACLPLRRDQSHSRI